MTPPVIDLAFLENLENDRSFEFRNDLLEAVR